MLERTHVLICGGTGCLSSHSKDIQKEFDHQLKELGIRDEVKLVLTGCFGLCEKGPVVIVYPDETFYSHVQVKDVSDICEEHLLKGRVVNRLVITNPEDKKKLTHFSELKF